MYCFSVLSFEKAAGRSSVAGLRNSRRKLGREKGYKHRRACYCRLVYSLSAESWFVGSADCSALS
jgi:hypothetical protein